MITTQQERDELKRLLSGVTPDPWPTVGPTNDAVVAFTVAAINVLPKLLFHVEHLLEWHQFNAEENAKNGLATMALAVRVGEQAAEIERLRALVAPRHYDGCPEVTSNTPCTCWQERR